MPILKSLFAFVLVSLTFLSGDTVAIELEEGVHYDVVSARPSDTKQVKEYFNYGCPGCYKSESLADMIKLAIPEGAKFVYVPFENHPSWKVYVEAYYIAEMLGIKEKAHDALFHRIHVEKKQIANTEGLKEFFVSLGADARRFDQAAKSFQLNSKLRLARKEAMQHKVLSTPTFVVNDYYRINSRAFQTNDQLIDAVKQLINQ